MSRRSRLKHEAAQVRGRIDRRAGLVRQRAGNLVRQLGALVRSPAALPVAFFCGMLAGRLRVAGIKRAYRLLEALVSQLKALRVAARLIGSPVH